MAKLPICPRCHAEDSTVAPRIVQIGVGVLRRYMGQRCDTCYLRLEGVIAAAMEETGRARPQAPPNGRALLARDELETWDLLPDADR